MNIRVENKNGHYEVYNNDKFLVSCDNMTEVNEEIRLIEKEKEEFEDVKN